MKRIVSIALMIFILSTTVMAYASMEAKLGNHWSKDLIEKEFIAYYFPYLAKDGFTRLDPRAYILKKDFSLSLGSLSKDYDLDINTDDIGIYKSLTRKEVVDLVGEKIINLEGLNTQNKELPFQDINTMGKDSIELLRLLYNLEIIKGTSKNSFAPDDRLTQAEAIIILQRVRGVLEGMREVAFNITGIVQSYNNQESILIGEEDDKVLVTLTKEFPTPGYGMGVEKIVRAEEGYKIHLDITPPEKDSIQLQVITYKTMTIEINKNDLKEEPPYVFIVDGIKSNLKK